MANDLSYLFQTLVAANSAAQKALEYQNTFVDSIFWDNRSIAATPFTTLNCIVPTVNEADTVDIGDGPIQPTDNRHNSYQVPFDKNYSNSFVIKEWEQGRTPMEMKTKYVQPRLEGFLRKVNRTIAAYFNSTTFNTYSLITGAGADVFQRADITAAWTNLATVGVPMDDSSNVFLTTSPLAYGNMLGSSDFIQNQIVAENAAVAAQQRAKLVNSYGAQVRYDQHLQPFEAGKEPGVFYHRYAMAGVTAPVQSMANQGGANVVMEQTIRLKGLPVRMQMWYSPDDQGVKIHYNCWWGVAPARTEMASLLETA